MIVEFKNKNNSFISNIYFQDKPLNLTLVSYAANGENITTRFITPGWLDPCEGNTYYLIIFCSCMY